MKLEVDEILISKAATADEVSQADFSCPVLLQVDDEHYLQWWIEEDDGSNLLCRRNGDWDTYQLSELGEYDSEAIKPVFLAYLAGDQGPLDKFEWEAAPLPGDPGVVITDHWEYYPCRFEDDSLGSIFYNHGISEIIDEIESTQCLRLRLALNEPDDEGFPNDAENETLEKIAVKLEDFVHQHTGIFFGHVTNQGEVVFYTYTDAKQDQTEQFIKRIQKEFGYELDAIAEEDPERDRYWEDLFPDSFSWQLLNDIKMTHELQEMGDDLTQARDIDHYASFVSADAHQAFSEWASEQGFKVESRPAVLDEDTNRYPIHLSRADVPELTEINTIAFGIREKCDALEGAYEGWESPVIAGQTM